MYATCANHVLKFSYERTIYSAKNNLFIQYCTTRDLNKIHMLLKLGGIDYNINSYDALRDPIKLKKSIELDKIIDINYNKFKKKNKKLMHSTYILDSSGQYENYNDVNLELRLKLLYNMNSKLEDIIDINLRNQLRDLINKTTYIELYKYMYDDVIGVILQY